MKDTRNFDRAPLKDIRVKDNQVGIRTPQVLIKREGGEYMKGDILDANATTELAKSIHIPDIEKINKELAKTVKTEQIGKPNGVASLDQNGSVPTEQLGNIDTNLFVIVDQLPEEDIKDGKIYCIRDTSSTDKQNVYIEYAYLNNKWEKIGEFKAEPDLSGYAKLSGATFGGSVTVNNTLTNYYKSRLNEVYINQIRKNAKGSFIQIPTNAPADELALRSDHITYSTDGKTVDVGTQEDFIFTLEDGSTVTKSIRVISTTSQAGA